MNEIRQRVGAQFVREHPERQLVVYLDRRPFPALLADASASSWNLAMGATPSSPVAGASTATPPGMILPRNVLRSPLAEALLAAEVVAGSCHFTRAKDEILPAVVALHRRAPMSSCDGLSSAMLPRATVRTKFVNRAPAGLAAAEAWAGFGSCLPVPSIDVAGVTAIQALLRPHLRGEQLLARRAFDQLRLRSHGPILADGTDTASQVEATAKRLAGLLKLPEAA